MLSTLDVDKKTIEIIKDLATNNIEVENLCCNWYYSFDDPEFHDETKEELLELVAQWKGKAAREK